MRVIKKDNLEPLRMDHLDNMSTMDREHPDRGGRIGITNLNHGANPQKNLFGRIMVEKNHVTRIMVIMIIPILGDMIHIMANITLNIQTNPITDTSRRIIKEDLNILIQIPLYHHYYGRQEARQYPQYQQQYEGNRGRHEPYQHGPRYSPIQTQNRYEALRDHRDSNPPTPFLDQRRNGTPPRQERSVNLRSPN